MDLNREWNRKIMSVTMLIRDKFPELSKYVEELRETIPDDVNPKITHVDLESYYNTLLTIFNRYAVFHDHDPKAIEL